MNFTPDELKNRVDAGIKRIQAQLKQINKPPSNEDSRKEVLKVE